MEPKAIIHKILLSLFVLTLAAWGTACTSSTTPEPTQQQKTQETTQQQKTQETTQQQKTQETAQQQQKTQETTQRTTAQVPPSATSSSDPASQLIGTWQATSIQGASLPPGTSATLTFSNDGTLQMGANGGSQNANVTGQYSVLDNSHLQMNDPNGETQVFDYNLSGDILTVTVRGITTTYQKTG